MLQVTEDLVRLFERYYVKKNPYYPSQGKEDCWIWIGPMIKSTGYPEFYHEGKYRLAHRVSYKIYKDDFDEGLLVRHQCHFPRCVNPDHLIQGTQADNIQDAVDAGRHCHGETHGSSKLTEADVIDIRKSHLAGERSVDIAKRHNIPRTHVPRICSGEAWGHIPDYIHGGRMGKFDNQDIERMRQLHINGRTLQEIADIYHISLRHAGRLINGR